jgi:16S rRNA (uracil1498-N3)-methyltransferase
MRHFVISNKNIQDDKAIITGSEARHVSRVLRRDVGDRLNLVDENGYEYLAVIIAKNPQGVEVKLLEKYSPPCEAPVKVVLGQALPKSRKMDYIVQKATELGVHTIIPFFSTRTVPRLHGERQEKKVERWKKIALEATKQCGRKVIPKVEGIVTFEEIIEKWEDNSLKIILWEDEKNSRLHKVLKNLQPFKKIVVLVGPEGGFTDMEIAAARKCTFQTAGLGSSILRTETAGIYLLSVLHYELGKF